MMKIIYLAATELPNAKSHSIQIMQTCQALAEEGAEVDLIARKIRNNDVAECFRFYGLTPHERFALRKMSGRPGSKLNRWHGRTFRAYLGWVIARNKRTHGRVCYYLRGTLKSLELIKTLKSFSWLVNPAVIYEAHTLQYRDLRDRFEDDEEEREGGDVAGEVEARRALEREIYPQLDGLVVITENLKRLIEAEFTVRCPILVSPSGARYDPGEALPPLRERETDIIYVGNLYRFNGVDVLVEAMKLLPEYRCVIVGANRPEDFERLRELVGRLGLEGRVELRGYVGHAEALQAIAGAKVAVAPLMKDSFDRVERYCSPAKLFEYMAGGCAIVATRLPSIVEILRDGEDAILVEPNSAEELASGIRRALEDCDRAEKLVAKARGKVESFSFRNRARRLIGFLEGILKAR
jgi:glycosyltransferase involved in cell wall biosynthesis